MFPSELFNDEGFRQLDKDSQRLLMWLWVHPDLNAAGIIAIQPREWANAANGLTEDDIRAHATELRSQGWVDFDDGQLWIRPFMQLDGAVRSPSTYVAAARAVKTVRSRKLRYSIWQLFKTFPRPVANMPRPEDDDPGGRKAKRANGLNASVNTAYAELERSIGGRGVRESLRMLHGIPHPIPHGMGSVGVGAEDEAEDDHPQLPRNGIRRCDCGRGYPVANGQRCGVCLGEHLRARQ